MANEIIRPTLLPSRADPVASEVVPSDNGSSVAGVTWVDGVNAAVPPASQAEAEAGSINTKRMTALTTKQAIDAQVPPKIGAAIGALNLGTASQAQVEDFATAVQGSKADSAVQPSRTVGVGAGLTGGGDLSADRTISLSPGTIASLGRADSSVQTVNGLTPDGSGNVVVNAEFLQEQNSVTTAMAESFAPTVEWVRTAGYAASGDGGGALYERVVSADPLIHHFQSADGAYWQWVDEGTTSEDILFRRRIAIELPWYNDDLKHFETLYGHGALYPQAFYLDTADLRAYILYGPVTAGANNYPVISIYDVSGSTHVLLTTFALNGGRWKECLNVKHVGAQRQLITAHDNAVMYDITVLPSNRAVISPTTTYSLPVNSMMGMDGDRFLVQYNAYDGLPIIHRSQFVWADESFSREGSVRLPPDVVGTLNDTYLPHIPKAQGIATLNGRVFVGTGGDAVPAYDMTLPRYQQGIAEVDANGNLVRRALVKPNEFRTKLGSIMSWVPDMIENEGLCASEGRLFSLWCCTHPNNRDTTGRTRGIVITEEMSMSPDAVNFVDAEYVWDKPIDPNAYARNTWMETASVPVDPILGTPLDSFAAVLNFMLAMAIPRMQMSFIGGHPMTYFKDINNANVATAGYWEFVLYAASALISRTGNNGTEAWGISGANTGSYVQTAIEGTLFANTYRYGGSNANPAFNGLTGVTYSRDGYISVGNASGTAAYWGRNTDGNIHQFYKLGVSKGSISINDTGVAFNQTSDATLKLDKGELTFEEACKVIELVHIHNFTWKDSGVADVGVFAQELYEVYPRAVMKGGWFMPDDDTTEVPEGTDGAVYRPWQVNYMALIPVMIRVMQGIVQ